METKKLILDQMAACSREQNWFAPLSASVKGLTVKEATWKPAHNTNSIYEILNHLIFWNDRYLKRFKNIDPGPGNIESNDDTFGILPKKLTSAGLNKKIKEANAIMLEFEKCLKKSKSGKLKQNVSAKNKYRWDSVLMNINAHNAYHTGQIALLRKSYGLWKGINWNI